MKERISFAEPLLEVFEERDNSQTSQKINNPVTKITLIRLCAIGFFINFSPADNYLTKFLRENKGLTEQELNDDIWPWSTYSTLCLFIPMAVIAETLGYRMTIFIGLICREGLRIILIYCEGVGWMASTQVAYAAAMAANTVYFSYAFMIFDEVDFHVAISWMHGSYYIGYTLGSILGSLIVDFDVTPAIWFSNNQNNQNSNRSVEFLFYLSWIFTSIGLLCFFILPKAKRSPPPSVVSLIKNNGFRNVLNDVKSSYDNKQVRIWSFWWIIGYGCFAIYVNYYQNQFLNIDPNGSFGYVGAFFSFFCVFGSALPSLITELLFKHSGIILLITSAVMGIGVWMSTIFQSSIYYSYTFATIFMGFYAFQYSAATAIIGKCLPNARYALINSTNSLLALLIATIVQVCCKGLTTDQVLLIIAIELIFIAFVMSCYYLYDIFFSLSFFFKRKYKNQSNIFDKHNSVIMPTRSPSN
eukprot:c21072_g1_i1.p1 GENE.c21072_g1_i1~~c21072_g1_i1.p1  ORF type:complete len:486 (+),score=151.79 c21072_g1_i1:47-1459(+)